MLLTFLTTFGLQPFCLIMPKIAASPTTWPNLFELSSLNVFHG